MNLLLLATVQIPSKLSNSERQILGLKLLELLLKIDHTSWTGHLRFFIRTIVSVPFPCDPLLITECRRFNVYVAKAEIVEEEHW